MIRHEFFIIKNRLLIPLILLLVTLGLKITPVHASTIGSFDLNGGYGARAIVDQILHQVAFGGTIEESTGPLGAVVFDLVLSEADIGKTYTVTSGTAFDQAVISLTNGENDWMEYFTHDYINGVVGGGSGEGGGEASFFFDDYTGTNGIDFAGYDIYSLSLTVNNLIFDTPGNDYNGDGIWTDVTFDATINVNTIPLPAAVWLFGSGLIGLVGVARCKKA